MYLQKGRSLEVKSLYKYFLLLKWQVGEVDNHDSFMEVKLITPCLHFMLLILLWLLQHAVTRYRLYTKFSGTIKRSNSYQLHRSKLIRHQKITIRALMLA